MEEEEVKALQEATKLVKELKSEVADKASKKEAAELLKTIK
jgi:hypothetical protein